MSDLATLYVVDLVAPIAAQRRKLARELLELASYTQPTAEERRSLDARPL